MYLLQCSWKRLTLSSLTVTAYLGIANGSEMQLPHWACSQKLPLSKTPLGICTVMVPQCAAASLSSGLCLAESKTDSIYCKLGICCDTLSEADPLNAPGSVDVTGAAATAAAPATAPATAPAPATAAAAAAPPVVQSVGVSFLVASGPPDMLTAGCTDMPPSPVLPVFALFLCMGPLGNCSASALFLCNRPRCICSEKSASPLQQVFATG